MWHERMIAGQQVVVSFGSSWAFASVPSTEESGSVCHLYAHAGRHVTAIHSMCHPRKKSVCKLRIGTENIAELD